MINMHEFSAIGIERLRMGTDGEGVTTLVAGWGCPLRCKYCLNPQCFLAAKPTACENLNSPTKPTITVPDLIENLKIDSLYFEATGGGVVFGGGEPLLQADFIRDFCEQRPKCWKISVETSLNVETEQLAGVVDYIDFFLVDIKDMNPEIYRNYTGKSNEAVKENLQYLIEHVGPDRVRVRIPLIPEFNTEEDRKKSINKLKDMGFCDFDLFSYDVNRSERKREKLKK